jgi:hypothetical protein
VILCADVDALSLQSPQFVRSVIIEREYFPISQDCYDYPSVFGCREATDQVGMPRIVGVTDHSKVVCIEDDHGLGGRALRN